MAQSGDQASNTWAFGDISDSNSTPKAKQGIFAAPHVRLCRNHVLKAWVSQCRDRQQPEGAEDRAQVGLSQQWIPHSPPHLHLSSSFWDSRKGCQQYDCFMNNFGPFTILKKRWTSNHRIQTQLWLSSRLGIERETQNPLGDMQVFLRLHLRTEFIIFNQHITIRVKMKCSVESDNMSMMCIDQTWAVSISSSFDVYVGNFEIPLM